MWSCEDNQEVGLEAATLERVRNSSLVKGFCADNLAGLKLSAEAMAFIRMTVRLYGWVGERRVHSEAAG